MEGVYAKPRPGGATRGGGTSMRWRYAAGAPASRWSSARQALAEKGVPYVLRLAVLWATYPLWRLYFKALPRTFALQSACHTYFLANYNLTWCNERAVEIPIVWAEVSRHRGERVLEVGNVLSHYFAVDHDILDKFESGGSVRTEDVVSFRTADRYDLIVSISTLEHVGWDEEPQDAGKISRAIANLSDHLAPGGRLLATLPLGYNPSLDAQLARRALPFTRCHYLKREGMMRWTEAEWPAVAGSTYGERWPGARGLVIAVIER
jgi:SAM-dependent methyltransferase